MKKELKVLLVDDDTINLMLLRSMLKKNPLIKETLEAKNGLEALNLFAQHSDIDLVLLDIKMPVMDGIECLINLQSNPSYKNTPVIVLTTDESKKREAFDNGAFDFLIKPIRDSDLREKIQKIADLI